MKNYLGIDCGSVSIKGVIIDEENTIIKSVYIKNFGLINTIKSVISKLSIAEDINGVGITGSGREFISKIIGGDIIESEIIAHYIASITLYPDIKTIIDIGGEDSKLMIISEGNLTSFQMNRDCVLPGDEVITTDFIPISIKDIKVGEEVLSHDGEFHRVMKVIKRNHNGPIYHINCGSSKLNVTKNHPVLVLKRKQIKCYKSKERGIQVCNKYNLCSRRCKKKETIDFEPKFITPDKIEKGDFLVQTIPSDYFYGDIYRYNKDLLRFFGYYLAEGNIEYNKSRKDKSIKYESGIALCFNINEKEYIDDVMETLKLEGFNPKYKSCKNNRGIIRIHNSKFAKKIKHLCGEYSHKKKLHSDLFKMDSSWLMNLVIGLFRGDGCLSITDRKRCLSLKTTSKELASQVSYILLSNNIKNTVTKYDADNKKRVFMVEINGEEINKFNDYDIINSQHKYYPMRCKYGYLVRVRDITQRQYKGDVYNLTVVNSNTYVCNNLAVHNCGGGTGAMIEAIASRMDIKLEDIGEMALKSKTKVNIPSKCGVFAQSAVVSKLNKGVPREDILMGVCRGLIGNYFTMLAKGIRLSPPYIFQGATANNKALVKCIEEELKEEVIVPENPELMGALGMAMLAREDIKEESQFKGFSNVDNEFTTKTYYGTGCTNQCEITQIFKNKDLIAYIGNRCENCINPELIKNV